MEKKYQLPEQRNPDKLAERSVDRFELSGLIGINYSLIENLDIGLRYNHGLTCISKLVFTDIMGNETGEHYNEYNQYFQFFLRFKI